jgi:hypothetical protein
MFFPVSDPAKVLQVASIGKRFRLAWSEGFDLYEKWLE